MTPTRRSIRPASVAAVLLAAISTAGCASQQPAPVVPAVAPSVAPEPVILPSEPAPPSGVNRIDGDLCKADDHQWLVGRSRAEIPVPVDVVNRRVTCTTCPMTEDYSPYRLNILFNQASGRVEQVRCG
jgi:hypothetical protein